jgi:hypothetical protein
MFKSTNKNKVASVGICNITETLAKKEKLFEVREVIKECLFVARDSLFDAFKMK